MPRVPIPGSGGAPIIPYLRKSIRLVNRGCANRPFYHIIVGDTKRADDEQCIEQVGSFDPMANERNESLVAFNFERVRYWMGEGAQLSRRVSILLGLSGFLPIHPRSYMLAWRLREEEPAYKFSKKFALKREEIIMKAKQYRLDKAAKEAEEEADQEQEAQAQ